ncbi:MAG: hypothetical protein K9L82_13065 [Chromatiaceae bacterium]|nr:hypothetical protein [Chromatiaceae bacterium]
MEEPVAIAEAVLGAHGLGADQATHDAAQGGAEAEARAGAQAARAGVQAATPTAKRAQQRQDAVSSRAGAGAGSADAERMLQATTFSSGHPLAGRRVLMTVGSTREAIDPVRFIGNRSSGKMGYALAEALRACGAQVMLIAGPTSVPAPVEMMRVDVESALQMRVAVMAQVQTCDLFIATAAVADYRPEAPVEGKIKKTDAAMTLTLVRNPDILAEVAALPKPPFTVGFAAETDALEDHARDKLEAKHLSMIAANRVGDGPGGFESDKNALICLWPGGGRRELPMMSKPALATALADLIAERYAAQSAG